ncbi:MAG: M23 family metallopeptidase [Treponema sp.]|nr:M23 family metallopeptidase [Treponema sp.]
MSTLKKYKKMENDMFSRLTARFSAAAGRFKAFGDRVGLAGRQKITIMLIPHSEKKILNLQFTVFTLAGIVFAAGLGLFVFVFSAARFSDTAHRLQSRSEDLKTTQSNLDQLRDQTSRLVVAAKRFQTALSGTLSKIGTAPSTPDSPVQQGDLASFFETSESGSGGVREIGDLRKITDYLNKTIDPVNQLGSLLQNQSTVLTEIPNIWPIKGGIGHISMYFGQNENPFTGQWYIHTGIDISTFHTGDPIVATADGKIVFVGYDEGYGNNVIIQHNHGFFTRYAHLQSFRVYKGEKVQQGQIIGSIGNTGLTTGPHLHYEVHLGTSVIDPLKFLNIRASATALAPGTGQ